MGRNISELNSRLTDHQQTQETKDANKDETLVKLYIEFVAIRKERETEKPKGGELGGVVRKFPSPIQEVQKEVGIASKENSST